MADEFSAESALIESRSLDRSRHNTLDDEQELQDAVAASSALVGENILDSPEQTSRYHTQFICDALFPHPSPKRGSSSSASEFPSPPPLPSLVADSPDALSVGLMAQGLAWVQRQRERGQRHYLRAQAEEQLRILRQANANKSANNSNSTARSLMDNPTFQNFISMTGLSTSSSGDSPGDGIFASTSARRRTSSRDGSVGKESVDDDLPPEAKVSQSGDGYTVSLEVDIQNDDEDDSWIPPVRVVEEPRLDQIPYILTAEQMQQIAASVLPRGIAYCRWKRLYSLAMDGDSFDSCLRLIAGQKHTLLVVRTSRDAIMGGFADEAWESQTMGGASYFGGSGTCLFRFDEDNKIHFYKWTGRNRYSQLVDMNHKMLAFGGGGDDGAFGLCVEQDFQVGSTGPCATFDNEPLCDEENFRIIEMEIFGFLLGQF